MADNAASRRPESVTHADFQAALEALRHVRAKAARLPDTVSDTVTPLTAPDRGPFIAALTALATSALQECARLAGERSEAEARQWVLDYLDTAIEMVTLRQVAALVAD
jgi:hypothetical protein